MREGLWVSSEPQKVERLASFVRDSASLAERLGANQLAVLLTADPSPDAPEPSRQLETAAANLRKIAGIAGDYGVRIGIEPIGIRANMLLESMTNAAAFLDDVDDRRVGVIFDTGHVHTMGEDLLAALDASWKHVQLIQLADMPGRVEPGTGKLPLVTFVAEILRRRYTGLIDLEHGWLDEPAIGEQAGLDRFRQFDSEVHTVAN